jgi:hypothetical protein
MAKVPLALDNPWTREEREAWYTALDKIASLAKIPADKVTKFQSAGFSLFAGAAQTSDFRQRGGKWDKLKKAEDALRDAYDAVRALNDSERDLVQQAFYTSLDLPDDSDVTFVDGLPLLSLLASAVKSFAKITGKSNAFEARGKNRPRGTVTNWQLQQFVGTLWCDIRECGGDLKYSCKENKPYGTMVAALNILRPLFPHLVPNVLPAKAILSVKNSLQSKSYSGFGFAVGFYKAEWEAHMREWAQRKARVPRKPATK